MRLHTIVYPENRVIDQFDTMLFEIKTKLKQIFMSFQKYLDMFNHKAKDCNSTLNTKLSLSNLK